MCVGFRRGSLRGCQSLRRFVNLGFPIKVGTISNVRPSFLLALTLLSTIFQRRRILALRSNRRNLSILSTRKTRKYGMTRSTSNQWWRTKDTGVSPARQYVTPKSATKIPRSPIPILLAILLSNGEPGARDKANTTSHTTVVTSTRRRHCAPNGMSRFKLQAPRRLLYSEQDPLQRRAQRVPVGGLLVGVGDA